MSYNLMPIDLFTSAKTLSSADKANLFTERMSSTAHQREVEDLKAAGLNPVLSADSSGATTGSAAQDDDESTYENPIYEFIKGVNTFTKTSAKTVEEANKNLNETIQNLLDGAVSSTDYKRINNGSDESNDSTVSPSDHSDSSNSSIKNTYGESANSNDWVHNDAKQSVSGSTWFQKYSSGYYNIDGSDDSAKITWSPLAKKMIPSKVRNALESYGYINDVNTGQLLSDYLTTPYAKSTLQGLTTGDPSKAIKTFRKMVSGNYNAGSTNKGTSTGTRVVGKKYTGNYGYNGKRYYNVLMER